MVTIILHNFQVKENLPGVPNVRQLNSNLSEPQLKTLSLHIRKKEWEGEGHYVC